MYKIILEKGFFKITEKEGLFLVGVSAEVTMAKLSYNAGNKDKMHATALKKLDEDALIYENTIVFRFEAPEVSEVVNNYTIR